MQNFLFLFIAILLNLLAIKMKIPILNFVFGIFGFVFAGAVQSEVGYPYFNLLVSFISFVSIFYGSNEYYYGRKRK